jgi:hypothetical protein
MRRACSYDASYDMYGFGLTLAQALMLREHGGGCQCSQRTRGVCRWNVIEDSEAYRGNLVIEARRALAGEGSFVREGW